MQEFTLTEMTCKAFEIANYFWISPRHTYHIIFNSVGRRWNALSNFVMFHFSHTQDTLLLEHPFRQSDGKLLIGCFGMPTHMVHKALANHNSMTFQGQMLIENYRSDNESEYKISTVRTMRMRPGRDVVTQAANS